MARSARETSKPRAIVASAARVRAGDRREAERYARYRQTWHDKFWQYYGVADTGAVGEVHNALNFKGDALSRVRLIAAIRNSSGEIPSPALVAPTSEDGQPLGDGQAAPIPVDGGAGIAADELDRLGGRQGGQASLMKDLAINLSGPGEAWLVGEETPDPFANAAPGQQVPKVEDWNVYSTDELVSDGQRFLKKDSPTDRGTELAEDSFVLRLWVPHPRWGKMADSHMRAALDYCEELDLLGKSARSAAYSRMMANGLMGFPDDLDFVGDETRPTGEGEQETDFWTRFTEAVSLDITEWGTARSALPVGIIGPRESLDALKHIKLDRSIDERAIERTENLVRRLARTLSVPVEVVLGLQETTFANAISVDDNTFRAYLEPLVVAICDALTVGFLWPALQGRNVADFERYVVWYDASALVVRPNRGDDADKAHEKLTISDAAYRRYKGFPDEDAPSDEELERRLAYNRSPSDAIMAELLRRTTSPDLPTQPAEVPSTEVTAEESTVPPGGEGVQGAGGRRRAGLDSLGAVLAGIDRALWTQVTVAADDAVSAAIRRAGSRLRTMAERRRDRNALDMLVGKDPVEFARTLGRARAERVGGFAEELVDDAALAGLRAKFTGLVGRSQDAARRAVALATGRDDLASDEVLLRRQAEDAERGWLVLSGALLGLARSSVFDPVTPTGLGEADASVVVPAAVVREALALAGGAEAVRIDGGSAPAGGVATGATVREALVGEGVAESGWVWSYGPPSLRTQNFEAHYDLDGVAFTSWTDPVLAVTDDYAWIGASYFFPGDHPGCSCLAEPQFVKVGEE